MTEENSTGPMTKILHSLFFILTFSFLLCFFWPWSLQPHVVEGAKKKKKEITGTLKDANRSQSGARAGRHLPLPSLAARGQVGGGGVGVEGVL